jgi:large subunit ribosomal protein L30
MGKKLRIRQIRSVINTKENHKRTIRALGIRRMSQTVIQLDNPAIRGMIHTVRHLVEVVEFEE